MKIRHLGPCAVLLILTAGCSLSPVEMPRIEPYQDARQFVPPPSPAPTEAAAHKADVQPQGPLKITVQEALLMALENNRTLKIERLNTPINRANEQVERAAFDPVLTAGAALARSRRELAEAPNPHVRLSETGGFLAITDLLPTGTTLGAYAETTRTWGDLSQKQLATRAGISVTQSLLRGAGLGPNLASLRQARLDTEMSEYELRGFAETLAANVENAYWDYVFAIRRVQIVEESLEIAKQQLEDTRQRVEVGTVAKTELAAGEAEVASRREELINAKGVVDIRRVQLARLVNPAALAWSSLTLAPLSEPKTQFEPLDELDAHVALGLKMRPEINHATLLIQRGQLQIVKTRNGLLPRMDLFANLGRTGYAGTFSNSLQQLPEDGYDATAGLNFQFPVTNRSALASDRIARLTLQQSEEALKNVQDLVRQDVEQAYIAVQTAREQVEATAATRRLQEEKLRAEQSKFQVGRSTSLLVATAERDLLDSKVSEIGAQIASMKALVTLYRMDGSLLERRGISAPGGIGATRN